MCGRTLLYTPLAELEKRFNAIADFDYEPRYNIAPRQDLATIRNTGHQHRADLGPTRAVGRRPRRRPRPINARAETLAEKRMFKEPFESTRHRRSSNGFYEWQGERGHKQPYRVCLEDNNPFAFAGLWNRWENNGDPLKTVTIITSEPNEVVAPIHDRMPVVLEPDQEREWLHAEPDRAQEVLGPYQGERPPGLPYLEAGERLGERHAGSARQGGRTTPGRPPGFRRVID